MTAAADAAARSLIAALYARKNTRLVCAVSGAGASGIARLLAVPGASSCVLEAVVPYSKQATDDFVQSISSRGIAKYASREAAVQLACASLVRAKSLLRGTVGRSADGSLPVGIGCASAISTIPPRRGENVCFVASISDELCRLYSLRFAKGTRSRQEEEDLCGLLTVLASCRSVSAAEAAIDPTEAAVVAPLLTDCSASSASGAASIPLFGELEPDCVTLETAMLTEALSRLHDDGVAIAAAPQEVSPSLSELVRANLPPVTHILFTPLCMPATVASMSVGASTTSGSRSGSRGAEIPGFDAVCNAVLPRAVARSEVEGTSQLPPQPSVLLVPGSFNPLHCGHVGMAAAAVQTLRELLRAPGGGGGGASEDPPPPLVVYELSAANVDKPPLAAAAVRARVQQFLRPPSPPPQISPLPPAALHGAATAPVTLQAASSAESSPPSAVLVTRAPRFVDKAALLGPGCAFALGFDTAARLVDPRYYGGSAVAMTAALGALQAAGTLVLVAGRVAVADAAPASSALPSAAAAAAAAGGGAAAATASAARPEGAAAPLRFLTLADLLPRIPQALRPMFVEIPARLFRADVSSTQLRMQQQQQQHS